MSTLTKSRRMPAKYCLRPGGITEIVYNATPEMFVVLPGTRWLEQRREREARLAASTPVIAHIAPPMVDTELTTVTEQETDMAACIEELYETEPLSWTDRMRIATTKLIRRQNPWLAAVRDAQTLQFSTQD